MYIPKINCEKWYVFLGLKVLKQDENTYQMVNKIIGM